MPERKPHILIDGFASHEEFRSRRKGRNPIIPPQDRIRHGQSLSQQYSNVLERFQGRREQAAQPITEDNGILVWDGEDPYEKHEEGFGE